MSLLTASMPTVPALMPMSGRKLSMHDPETCEEEERGNATRRLRLTWRSGAVAGLLLAGSAIAWLSPSRSPQGLSRTQQGSQMTELASQIQGADSWIYTGVYDIPVEQPAKPIPGAPSLDLRDGNPCYSDEELLGGLCYKKCSLLTADEYPVRGTPISCCREHPCSLTNQKVEPKVCSGFDVSGDMLAPGSCPHQPGACLQNEELFLGYCYKKCTLLTDNKYSHRTAAATCCKETSTFECLKFGNIQTSSNFNVGGGAGDNDDRTPAEPHLPMVELAEQTTKKL